jgi:3-dehydroquinate synthase
MNRVKVTTENDSYDAIVDPHCIERAAEYIRPLTSTRRLFVVADAHALKHHRSLLERGLAGMDFVTLSFDGGEKHKRLDQIELLAKQMYSAGADRSACVIAFGGGVVGDMSGFLAASYMRGIDVIHIPTTLLSQVDASVGGKTGVNLAEGKNLIGAFHQPLLVLIDPTLLDTLPEREYRAGLFEVIKYGVIWNPALFNLLKEGRDLVLKRDRDTLETLIADSIRIKAEIVGQDERESDLRRILNYGHTLGHPLEAETNYIRLLHGEAVGFGMVVASRLAKLLGMFDEEECASLEALIAAYGPIPELTGVDPVRLVSRIHGDKKTLKGHVHFVLPEKIGAVRVVRDPEPSFVMTATQTALESFGPGSLFTTPPSSSAVSP